MPPPGARTLMDGASPATVWEQGKEKTAMCSMYRSTRQVHSRITGAAVLMGLGMALAVNAEPTNILPFSDSITYGQGDGGASATWRGYSDYLQELLNGQGYRHGVDYDFIGGRGTGSGLLSDGLTPFDADRWGSQGALAAGTPNANPYVGGNNNNLVYQLQNQAYSRDGGVTLNGIFTGLNAAGTAREAKTADTVLIHIGSNPILGDSATSPRFGSLGTVAETTAQFGNLLTELRVQWDAGRIASDANIIVARIIPKAINSGGSRNDDDTTVRNTAAYNDAIVAMIGNLPTATQADAQFKARFSTVDMFNIQLTAELQSYLTPAELALVNTDGDSAVDWIVGLNESNPSTFNDDTLVFNSSLLSADAIHPTDLGYKLMAWQWYQAIEQSKAIPEPSVLALLGIGALTMLGRRPGRQQA